MRTVATRAAAALALTALAALPLLAGCGADAGFEGASGKRTADAGGTPPDGAKEPPGDGEPVTPAPFRSLTWFWQCADAPVTAPAPRSAEDPVVEGMGPHVFDRTRLDGTPMTFSGRLCEPEQIPRDIVLVIDTSGSMVDNDPRVGNTCGRLQAVEAVLAQVQASGAGANARVGLVTFNSLLDRSSSALFDTEAALFADVTAGGAVADVVCNAIGGTNYDAGLTRAQELLATGRAGATKEIYFVSDGQPNVGQDGVLIANALKTTGVNIGTDFITATIATVMLAGQDTVLEQLIASRDPTGKPLHAFVANTAELTRVLAELTENVVVGGWLRYRPLGSASGEWTTLDLEGHLQGFNFTLPSVNIDVGGAPDGLEVLFEYWDKHDNRYSTRGKLLWTADGGNGS